MKALYYVEDKSDALAPHRYSLLLLKVGCAVSTAEFLPVSKELWESVEQGDMLELTCRKTDHTKADAERIMLAEYPKTPKHHLSWNRKYDGLRACEALDPNEP